MRLVCAVAVVVLIACSEPAASTAPASQSPSGGVTRTPSPSASPTLAACHLPIWWPDANNTDIDVAQLGIPSGAVSDARVLRPSSQTAAGNSFQFYGATYFGADRGWSRLNRQLVSPDGERYTYWTTAGTSTDAVHVEDIRTGADRVVYSGSTLYFPIAWTNEGIYMVDAVAPRQGAFKNLYRLDPIGGSGPQLVSGADRHMYQWGWVLIADGAAWGIDNAVSSNGDYTYSVLRLDLKTSQVVSWFGPVNDMFWPIGVDLRHRLYVSDGQQLDRVGIPGTTIELTPPGPDAIFANQGIGSESGFVADSTAAWLSGKGGVWRYADDGRAQEFTTASPDAIVDPAAGCL